jgi:hypothetical protein
MLLGAPTQLTWSVIMKNYLIAIASLAALSTTALADPGSVGESRFVDETVPPAVVAIEPAAAPAPDLLILKTQIDEEERRLQEKNGSKG